MCKFLCVYFITFCFLSPIRTEAGFHLVRVTDESPQVEQIPGLRRRHNTKEQNEIAVPSNHRLDSLHWFSALASPAMRRCQRDFCAGEYFTKLKIIFLLKDFSLSLYVFASLND